MSTRSVIARPTPSGFRGIYCHKDGQPSHQLPLILGAFQYRFGEDADALARHLVDDVPVGWSALGTDLLDGAPDELRTAPGIGRWPGRQYSSEPSAGGRVEPRAVITERTSERLTWAYVLHAHGVEVIGLGEHRRGPVVPWSTDPLGRFTDTPGAWRPDAPLPILSRPGPAAAASARSTSARVRSVVPHAPAGGVPAAPPAPHQAMPSRAL
ncbi:hypothetical protein [Kitasatospora purpeofusca]|uniref:hypothetical protein n=1 Tax=Kitasatospora purpeofusca TaxID=67352 RepID=UPI0022551DA1|nr:hypothetical protein [Kitasatospora purpeofusca]MCX4758797.1 hypothetical protein [Kitasatospora purpeofusca]WSR30775.1 hypothetical protein OG715_07205 [Kitasatospora purpeofusca]